MITIHQPAGGGGGGAAQTSANTAGNAGGNSTFGSHVTGYGRVVGVQ